MKQIYPLLLIGMSLSGCQETNSVDLATLTPQEQEAVMALRWLEDADATRDAARAKQDGDLHLYALSTRAPSLPGVESAYVDKIKGSCELRYLEGFTDAVQGEVHQQLLQQARDYAAAFNRLMLDSCVQQSD